MATRNTRCPPTVSSLSGQETPYGVAIGLRYSTTLTSGRRRSSGTCIPQVPEPPIDPISARGRLPSVIYDLTSTTMNKDIAVGSVSRRLPLRRGAQLGIAGLAVKLLAACGQATPATPTAAPTAASKPTAAATSAPVAGAPTAAAPGPINSAPKGTLAKSPPVCP